MNSLQGHFSRAVANLGDELKTLRLFVEATLDFPDEEDVDRGVEFGLTERLVGIVSELESLRGQTRQAVTLNQGVTVAILGAPNAGKSSLLNALCGEDRAIVTEIAGTTRDLLPVDLIIGGLPVRLVDTAGLRQTADRVEGEGVRRAFEAARRADLVLWVVDAAVLETRPNDWLETERQEIQKLDQSFWSDVEPRLVSVLSKRDRHPGPAVAGWVDTSARTGLGIEPLTALLRERAGLEAGFGAESAGFTARARHLEALDDCAAALADAAGAVDAGDGGVLLAEDLRAAHDALGRILGRVTPDDLLGEIFSEFCIGK